MAAIAPLTQIRPYCVRSWFGPSSPACDRPSARHRARKQAVTMVDHEVACLAPLPAPQRNATRPVRLISNSGVRNVRKLRGGSQQDCAEELGPREFDAEVGREGEV